MKALWWSAGALAVTIVVVQVVQKLRQRHAEGKSPMSPQWLNENVYDKHGDRRWK